MLKLREIKKNVFKNLKNIKFLQNPEIVNLGAQNPFYLKIKIKKKVKANLNNYILFPEHITSILCVI